MYPAHCISDSGAMKDQTASTPLTLSSVAVIEPRHNMHPAHCISDSGAMKDQTATPMTRSNGRESLSRSRCAKGSHLAYYFLRQQISKVLDGKFSGESSDHSKK
jgi:hypothetical protein